MAPVPWPPVLRLVLPKGSLERATLELFEAADLQVSRSSNVAYRATVDDPRITDVRILRPQEIPRYIAEGLFDLGITGRDWIEETASDVVSLGTLEYSKSTSQPIRLVLAVAGDSPVEQASDLPAGVRVSTEYPELTRRYFEKLGIPATVRLSYGATQAGMPLLPPGAPAPPGPPGRPRPSSEKLGPPATVRLSYGATEAGMPSFSK